MLPAAVIACMLLFWSCGEEQGSGNGLRFRSGGEVLYDSTWQFLEVISETSWTVSVSYEDPGNDGWCTLGQRSGNGQELVRVDYSQNEGPTRTADFTVDFGDETMTVRLTQLSREGSIGEVLDVLLELPEMQRTLPDSLRFVTHYVPYKGFRIRNYSILYDVVNHIPVWVAYPVHSVYRTPDTGRTNAWAFDPQIGNSLQPNLFRAMSNGYDRGHMLPSASRYLAGTNEQTFYYTNMTPQLNGFNANLWERMEARERGWQGTGADTLYVVTGAVLRTVGGNENITYTYSRNDPDRRTMAVPNYYYKALLKRTISNDEPQYRGVAFWFEHEPSDRNPQWSDAISIRELERRTGINFFAGLEAGIQEQVENNPRPGDWGFVQ